VSDRILDLRLFRHALASAGHGSFWCGRGGHRSFLRHERRWGTRRSARCFHRDYASDRRRYERLIQEISLAVNVVAR